MINDTDGPPTLVYRFNDTFQTVSSICRQLEKITVFAEQVLAYGQNMIKILKIINLRAVFRALNRPKY